MKDIIKIVKSLEHSGPLMKEVTQKIENETKEQKDGFLGMLLGSLSASLIGNMLASKEVNRAGKGVRSAGERTIRVGQVFWCCLIV